MLSCRSRGIKIEGGRSYYLKITPQVHNATPSFNDLSLKNRKCKLSKEIPDGSFLTSYSEQGCAFECVLRHAVSCITFRAAVPTTLHTRVSPVKCYFHQNSKQIALLGIIPPLMEWTTAHCALHTLMAKITSTT